MIGNESIEMAIRQNLHKMANQNDYVFWLDSCRLHSAQDIGDYDLIVGFGAQDKIELTSDTFDWGNITSFVKDDKWKFFALSYEMKSKTSGLSGSNPDPLQWPLISCVKPEIVVAIKKNGEVETVGISVSDILNYSAKPDKTAADLLVQYDSLAASMSQIEHSDKVSQIKLEIAAGNMYEMNLCIGHTLNNFTCNQPFELYKLLISGSPTPFSSFLKINHKHVLCASPERYLFKDNDSIYAQPIKGTSKRYVNENADAESRLRLVTSVKERAEHIMIVDLVRNDLSKLSKAGTVRVEELFGIYGYKHVNQMISTISGELNRNINFADSLQATYPMGSMTGAPKYIVQKFIDALETTARGWYSGSIGYIDPKGNMDSNVVIRTLLYDSKKDCATFAVGGAITFDSDPDLEYEECLLKSKAIRNLLDIN
ncbi:MAG: para-aminobenzoate synthetase component 1 [bacterium]|jgi:para-aminobenzoate synthetase component 1